MMTFGTHSTPRRLAGPLRRVAGARPRVLGLLVAIGVLTALNQVEGER